MSSELDALRVPPVDAPRPVTRSARRRSWNEPRVRIWWIVALALVAVTAYVVGSRLLGSAADRTLINSGVKVDAMIKSADGISIAKRYEPEKRSVFEMEVTLPGREPYIIKSRLPNQRQAVGPGMTVPLYVDPADPSRWTDRTRISVGNDLLMGALLIPPALLMLGIAWLRRREVLRVWQTGQAAQAIVLDVRQSPTAPGSRLVQMTLRDSKDNRVFTSLLPRRLGQPQQGDLVWVVAPPHQAQRAVVAALYQ